MAREKTNPDDVIKNAIKQLQGLNLGKTSKSMDSIQKAAEKMRKSFDAVSKGAKTQNKALTETNKNHKATVKVLKDVMRANKAMLKTQKANSKEFIRQRRLIMNSIKAQRQSTKATKSMAGAFRSLAASIGLASAAYAALNRMKSVADTRLQFALQVGPQAFKGQTTSALQLLTEFSKQSAFARFGVKGSGLDALVKMQEQLAGLGKENANRIILAVTKTLEPRQLARFISVGQRDLKSALMDSAILNTSNVDEITTALNALKIQQMQAEGTLDPLLDASLQIQSGIDKFKETFDSFVDRYMPTILDSAKAIMEWVQKQSPGKLAGYGAAGLAGYAGLRSPAIGAIVAAVLASHQFVTWAKHGAGATIGGKLVDALYTPSGGYDARGVDARQSYTSAHAREARDYIKGLASKRGMSLAAYAKANQAELRANYGTFFDTIFPNMKETKAATHSLTDSFRDLINKGIDKLKTGVEGLKKSASEANLAMTQHRAAQMESLQMENSLASARTGIRQLQLQRAKLHPLGTIAAMPEMRALSKSFADEIVSLRKVLQNIDTNTYKGQLEALGIQQQIESLKLQDKQLNKEFTRLMLDSVLQEAMGAGRFSKILVDYDRSLGVGLSKGMVNPNLSQFTGSINNRAPSRKPIRPKVDNAADAIETLGKAAIAAVPFLAEMFEDDTIDNDNKRPMNSSLN